MQKFWPLYLSEEINLNSDIFDILVLKGSEILNPQYEDSYFRQNIAELAFCRVQKFWPLYLSEKINLNSDIFDTLVLKGSEILNPLISRFVFLPKYCGIGILQGAEILTPLFIRRNQFEQWYFWHTCFKRVRNSEPSISRFVF